MELLDKKLGGTAPLDIVLNAPSDWALEEEGFDDTRIMVDNNGEISNYVQPTPEPEIDEEEVVVAPSEEVT